MACVGWQVLHSEFAEATDNMQKLVTVDESIYGISFTK